MLKAKLWSGGSPEPVCGHWPKKWLLSTGNIEVMILKSAFQPLNCWESLVILLSAKLYELGWNDL